MKKLTSNKMKSLLKRGESLAKKKRAPSDGYMQSLIYEDAPNGWHYRVEYIHDTRLSNKPYVIVYGFKPPRVYHAKSAEYYLSNID